jgi:hypothetical protein
VVLPRGPLKDGDVAKVGDVALTVKRDGEGWALVEERTDVSSEDKEAIARQAAGLSINRNLPRFKILILVSMLIVALAFFVLPIMQGANSGHYQGWNSGPISNQHAMIADKCQACHVEPFQPVQDNSCLACHNLSQHAETMPVVMREHLDLNRRCAECHMEHNGDHGVVLRESKHCAECHAQIKTLVPDTKQPNIATFLTHNQFAVGLRKDLSGGGRLTTVKVSLDDTANLVDPTHIKLNHSKHLEPGLRGPKGPVNLTCGSCHIPDALGRAMQPIDMEKSCVSCHPLGFDDRLPTQEVPHGSPDVVFNFLYAEYAKLFLADKGSRAAQVVSQRFKPGQTAAATAQVLSEAGYSRVDVEREARKAEDLLFTRTACVLCHDVAKKDPSSSGVVGVDDQTGVLVSQYKVLNPEIPNLWMPAAVFSHSAHGEVACESCHEGTRQSSKTTDVLMPKIEGCRECHLDPGTMGKVRSDCVMCHSYHDPLPLEETKKRDIERILYELIER